MKGSFFSVLAIIMLGMMLGFFYFISTRTEAATISTATAEDCQRIKLRDPKVTCIPGVTPFTDSDAQTTGKSSCDFPGDAKAYLVTKTAKPASHVEGMAENFACCLAKFIQAGQSAGYNITINSGYRSVEHQTRLFTAAVKKYGSESAARKWVAPPGRSNHNRGIAADLSAVGRSWQHKNAGIFGLTFRMAHEPWHIEPNGNACSGAVSTTNNTTTTAGGSFIEGVSQGVSSDLSQGGAGLFGTLLQALQGGGGSSSGGGYSSGGTYDLVFDDGTDPVLESSEEAVLHVDDIESIFNDLLSDSEDDDFELPEGVSDDVTNVDEGVGTANPVDIETTENGGCSDGYAARTTVYGTVVCVRDSGTDGVTTSYQNLDALDSTSLNSFSNAVSQGEGLAKRITTFANYVLPLEYIVGDDVSDLRASRNGLSNQFTAYDVYQPNEGVATYRQTQTGLTEEQFIAWLLRNDVIENNPAKLEILGITLGLVRPATMHIVVLLFGTGSYATNAVYDALDNFSSI